MYVIVAGGGKVGFYLGKELVEQGHEVLIIERGAQRAAEIEAELGMQIRNAQVSAKGLTIRARQGKPFMLEKDAQLLDK